jgi:chemotaxis protein MotB
MNPRVHRSRVTHDRWLVSYADFITLLFAFFVVLYAFARSDHKKQVEVSASIDSAFKSLGFFPQVARRAGKRAPNPSGVEPAVIPMNIVMGEEVLQPARVKDDLESMRRELSQKLSNQVGHHTVSIAMGREGLVISLREAGFFDSGSATPRAGTRTTLQPIADALGRTPYDVRVEGDTDNVPMHTEQFDSNWELSAARATRVARLLLEMNAVSPDRLSAAGYAEFHPVASNATEQGRAENRRVDLVILPRTELNFGAGGDTNSVGAWARITDGDQGEDAP